MAIVFDVEVYRNYCLVVFLRTDTGAAWWWEMFNDHKSGRFDVEASHTHIGFNSINYDMPILSAIAANWSNSQIKELSDDIIVRGAKHWDMAREYGIHPPYVDHVDIIQVLPLMAGLKVYGARIGSKRLQDLPIEPSATITPEQVPLLRRYCYNDCVVTAELYNKIEPQIELRGRLGLAYGLELRSKSDAQIAEAIIDSEIERRIGAKIAKPKSSDWLGQRIRYTPPKFVRFKTEPMRQLLKDITDMSFEISSSGSVLLPKGLANRDVVIGGNKYKLGIGGLHSVDGPGSFYQVAGTTLADIDVASYYPSIILNAEYYPEHIGPVFLEIYRDLVTKRLEAKKRGDKVTADALKITVNGTFGKLGSKYSKLYAPNLMLHVTVTGQLCLLMLIEQLEYEVVSANTDGILVQYNHWQEDRVMKVVSDWEALTGFNMEWTAYRSYHRRDVNNYVAIKPDGKIKTKGIFAPAGLMKNPVNEIVIDSVIEHLRSGAPIRDTINGCTDVGKFLTLRTVKGGAVKDDVLIGKSVRWYYSKESGTAIHYKTNGNKVPNSDEGVPLMDLTDEIPADLDYRRYWKEAEQLLETIK